jgi:hypothetical protein
LGISLVHEVPRSAHEVAYTLTECHSSAPVMLDRGHEDKGCLVQTCLTASRATRIGLVSLSTSMRSRTQSDMRRTVDHVQLRELLC